MPASHQTDTNSKALIDQAIGVLAQLRDSGPRVHCLTNALAQAWTANVLLALGVEPSMTWAQDQISDFIETADGLLINLGTLEPSRYETAIAAAGMAARTHKAFVLDPVYAHRTPTRLKVARQILAQQPDIVRGNAREIEALAVDHTLSVSAQSGVQDHIRYGGRAVLIRNGTSQMARVTAMGCALGAMMAACLAVEDDPFQAAVAATLIYGIAGEIADEKSKGPGSFAVAFLDALFAVTANDIANRARLECLS